MSFLTFLNTLPFFLGGSGGGKFSTETVGGKMHAKQITVKLSKAGSLHYKIGLTQHYKAVSLKIVGEINGTDWRLIRHLAGRDFNGQSTSGKLMALDLSEAKIVSGGDNYSYRCLTSDNALGNLAFEGCRRLTGLSLPSGITSIGVSAFEDCSGLTDLSVPSGVTSISHNAFKGCSRLTSLSLPPGLTSIASSSFHGCSRLTSLSIPSGVTSIGSNAFEGCSRLISLSLPPGLTSIASSSFHGCSRLTSLSIPSSVTSIGSNAFEGCSGLTSLYIYSEHFSKLGKDIFKGCNAKKCTLYVPVGTTDAFWLSEFGYFKNIVEFDPTDILYNHKNP